MRKGFGWTHVGLALLAMAPAATLASGDGCKFAADRAAGTDARGVEKVMLRTGAGDLKVIGSPKHVRIEARGKACASTQELLDQSQISVRREGNTVYVETALPQGPDGAWTWAKRQYAYIDTGIALPANVAVEAIDSSGDAEFEGLASLQLQDSSGDLEVERIEGLADIADSSGDIEIEDVGSVKLRDSSGDIEIERVRGPVEIDHDSSGDIRIRNVAGSVRIHNDSSGGIHVTDVQGDFEVDVDSSGDIHAGRITGNFTVGSDGSGSIRHDDVGGKVSIPSDKMD